MCTLLTLPPANNCLFSSTADASVCTQCGMVANVQFQIVPDGSCQPPPVVTATLTWGVQSATLCSTPAFTINTDPNSGMYGKKREPSY